MNGYFIEYYSTGQKFRESFFLKGLLISSKYFDISGSEISNGDFFLGTGQLLIFNQNGVICEEQVYKNGKRLK